MQEKVDPQFTLKLGFTNSLKKPWSEKLNAALKLFEELPSSYLRNNFEAFKLVCKKLFSR